jgi:hypothetical protein
MFVVGDEVEVKDATDDDWEPGTVEAVGEQGLPLVRILGYDTAFTWKNARRAHFEIGDEVDVKDDYCEEWEPGTVQALGETGTPLVRKEGYEKAFSWAHVRPSPTILNRKRVTQARSSAPSASIAQSSAAEAFSIAPSVAASEASRSGLQFTVGDLVEVKDGPDDDWESGTVEGATEHGLQLVRKLGYDTAFTWGYVRRAVFAVGDEVEVKDETDDEWEPGTVAKLDEGGAPLVRKDGYDSAFTWGCIRRNGRESDEQEDAFSVSQSMARSVASSLAPSARTGGEYSIGDGVYVQDESGDDWQGSVQILDENGEPRRVLIWARNNKKAFKPRPKSEPRKVLIHSRARYPTSPTVKQRIRQEHLEVRRQEVLIHARSRRPNSPAAVQRKQVASSTSFLPPQVPSSARFAVGDQVDVKDATDDEWEPGIVQEVDHAGAPRVHKEGFESAFAWAHVRRSPVPINQKIFAPPLATEADDAGASTHEDASFKPAGSEAAWEAAQAAARAASRGCPGFGHGVLRVYALDFALSQGLSASPGGATPTTCAACGGGLAGARGQHATFYGCKRCRHAVCLGCFLERNIVAEAPSRYAGENSDEDGNVSASSTETYATSLPGEDDDVESDDDSDADCASLSSTTVSSASGRGSNSPPGAPPVGTFASARPTSPRSGRANDASSPRVSESGLRWAGGALTPAQLTQAWRDTWRSPGSNLAHPPGPPPHAEAVGATGDLPDGEEKGYLRNSAGRRHSGGSSSKQRRERQGQEYAALSGDDGSGENGSGSGDDEETGKPKKGYSSVAARPSEEDDEDWDEDNVAGSGCSCCCGCFRCGVGACCLRAPPGGKSRVDAESASGCCSPATAASARAVGRAMLWAFPVGYLAVVAYCVWCTDRVPNFARRTYKPGRPRWPTVAVVLPLCGFLAALVGNTVPLSGGLIFLPVLILFNITGQYSTLPFCACMSVVSVGYLGFANNLVRGPDKLIWKAFPHVVLPAVAGHAIGVVRK